MRLLPKPMRMDFSRHIITGTASFAMLLVIPIVGAAAAPRITPITVTRHSLNLDDAAKIRGAVAKFPAADLPDGSQFLNTEALPPATTGLKNLKKKTSDPMDARPQEPGVFDEINANAPNTELGARDHSNSATAPSKVNLAAEPAAVTFLLFTLAAAGVIAFWRRS